MTFFIEIKVNQHNLHTAGRTSDIDKAKALLKQIAKNIDESVKKQKLILIEDIYVNPSEIQFIRIVQEAPKDEIKEAEPI